MHLKEDINGAVYDILFRRLSDRGLMSFEIARVIKDICNIVRDGGDFTVPFINRKLELLGWRERIIDETSFELIIFVLENEYGYEVKRHILH